MLGAIVSPFAALGIVAIDVHEVALLAALGRRHGRTGAELDVTIVQASDTGAGMHGRLTHLTGRHNVVVVEHALAREIWTDEWVIECYRSRSLSLSLLTRIAELHTRNGRLWALTEQQESADESESDQVQVRHFYFLLGLCMCVLQVSKQILFAAGLLVRKCWCLGRSAMVLYAARPLSLRIKLKLIRLDLVQCLTATATVTTGSGRASSFVLPVWQLFVIVLVVGRS